MRKVLVIISAVLCMGFSSYAHDPSDPGWQNVGFIEPGTQWEVEVKSNINPEEPAMRVTEYLDGSELIGDKWYLKLWVKVGDETPRMTTYIRIQHSPYLRIYAMDPENLERGDRLIYVLTAGRNIQEEPLTSLNWDGTLSDEEYSFDIYCGDELENNGNKWPTYTAFLFPWGADKTEENILGNVTWIFALGGTHGFTNQCYSLSGDYTTTLKRIITECSGVVYDASGAAGVNYIDCDTMTDMRNIKYRIDGTVFHDGEKGIYIMNGKKYIAR